MNKKKSWAVLITTTKIVQWDLKCWRCRKDGTLYTRKKKVKKILITMREHEPLCNDCVLAMKKNGYLLEKTVET